MTLSTVLYNLRHHVLMMPCRDGERHNLTWNCGEEGPTSDGNVLDLRSRQVSKRPLSHSLLAAHSASLSHPTVRIAPRKPTGPRYIVPTCQPLVP